MNLPVPPWPALLLYSRDGCCLCDGLEERLRALVPPPPLEVVNVDRDPQLQARYGLEVPLLAVVRQGRPELLPRVGPRLAGDGLQRWLRKCLVELPAPPPCA